MLNSGANVFGKCDMKHRCLYRRKNLDCSNAKWTVVITHSKFIRTCNAKGCRKKAIRLQVD